MSDLDIDIEEAILNNATLIDVAVQLNVPIAWVTAVWDRMMKEMDEFIANPPPRMTDAEYEQAVAEMHGDD